MGDFLFDWAITKLARTNDWSAARDGVKIDGGSLEELREKVIEHVTKDDPLTHLYNLLEALRLLDDEAVLDRLGDQDDIDAIRNKVQRADAYLRRVAEKS